MPPGMNRHVDEYSFFDDEPLAYVTPYMYQ